MANPKPDADAGAAEPQAPIGHVKLPPFWASDPQIWFAQVEAQFTTRRIVAQRSKFAHVVSALQPEIAQEVRDLLLAPPAERPYDVLKEQLIRRTSESEQRRLQQLLTEEELGDRKPSQLLRKMRQLLGEHELEKGILKQLFVQRLPASVQLILATASTALSNEQLADLADRIMDVPVPTVQAAHVPPSADALNLIADLKQEISRLAEQVRSLHRRVSSRSRSRGRPSQSRSQASNTQSPGQGGAGMSSPTAGNAAESELCWYHERWGTNAHKCRPPCSFAGNAPTSG